MSHNKQDYGRIKENLRKFIAMHKKSKNPLETIMYIRFIMEIRNEINDHLKKKGFKCIS